MTNTTLEEQRSWFQYEEDKKQEMILKVNILTTSPTMLRLRLKLKESKTYDAVYNDISFLNVYFGENTAICRLGKKHFSFSFFSEYERSLRRTTIEILVDMAAWFGENSKLKHTL